MIESVQVEGVFAENCYFYLDPQTRQGFIIDPGAEADTLLAMISRSGVDIQAILLTHGHFDHTGAVQELHDRLGIPYYILAGPGRQYLTNPQLNLSAGFGAPIILPDAGYFQDGDFISLPGNSQFGLRVIATPGHTPDSVVLYSEADQAAFVGDTIFAGSPGTTQFPGGNQADLADSILNKVLKLPNNTTLYSGHSGPTTVGREKPNYM
ncbi:MAG: MBL fold metallo-hydrolase [Desulfovibrio sp.]|nr:MBL fold metallo-hydrolase [Desulfovibrio sp.]